MQNKESGRIPLPGFRILEMRIFCGIVIIRLDTFFTSDVNEHKKNCFLFVLNIGKNEKNEILENYC
jgi:hypothetical protein